MFFFIIIVYGFIDLTSPKELDTWYIVFGASRLRGQKINLVPLPLYVFFIIIN